MKQAKNIVLGVTGSIAAFKAAEIASCLAKAGACVHVVMTREAEAFITPLTLQILSSNKVHRGMFDMPESWDVEHVALADLADLVVVAPATANIIGKLAAGICDDFLTCIVTATRAPVLLAPAMNEGMYRHEVVQENIAKLKKIGYAMIGPEKGRLACGSEGLGRMSAPQKITAEVLRLLKLK
ncbi:MAG: flavoprotein [Candidatus Omnitrophica bacterium]|nr:flavoprotein [Candidatus Omnitrophota bacterium]MDD5573711.1 flavoprotein [Candidatus Omnitrophota bacterium]